ncbi:MAG: UDP-2,3-diacylglucosamine diphosphatase LpxI, partial [Firmicutes bacterium]|nr:UDP-2,3-diacylglucosamine diphosphatase LpxI [Bacillota bacterium]
PDWSALMPDLRGVKVIPGLIKAARQGDDALLRRVLDEFEAEGFEIEGAHEVRGEMTLPSGVLGAHAPRPQDQHDIARALLVAREIGKLDVGQGAVVCEGLVLAVEAQAGGVRVWGFLTPPSFARRSRSGQYFFVNRRPVTSPLLSRAVEQGARTLVFTGQHPACALYVELAPELVDPNVHPRKLEVRFADEGRVFAAVERAVRDAYRSRPLVRAVPLSASPPPAAAPEATGWQVREPTQLAVLEAEPRARLPRLRVLGQLASTYLLAESAEGLVVVDQHAAHERVLYERLLRDRTRGAHAQLLAAPVTVDLSPSEVAVLPEVSPVLRELGLEVEPFGGSTVLVRSVPVISGRLPPEGVLRACLREGLWDGAPTAGQRAVERAASVVACHSAVRAGDALSVEEMRALLQDLERCDDPYTCFHGRPTLVVVPLDRLEGWFLRR